MNNENENNINEENLSEEKLDEKLYKSFISYIKFCLEKNFRKKEKLNQYDDKYKNETTYNNNVHKLLYKISDK